METLYSITSIQLTKRQLHVTSVHRTIGVPRSNAPRKINPRMREFIVTQGREIIDADVAPSKGEERERRIKPHQGESMM